MVVTATKEVTVVGEGGAAEEEAAIVEGVVVVEVADSGEEIITARDRILDSVEALPLPLGEVTGNPMDMEVEDVSIYIFLYLFRDY